MALDFVFNAPQSLREICAGTYKTEAALQALIVAAMAVAAAAAQTFTCSVSVTGYSGQDVQNVCRILGDMGFTVSQSSSTLTISW
jgi:malonyl CoA-acyl carrier protein transacylase